MESFIPSNILGKSDGLRHGTIKVTAADYIQNHVAQPSNSEPPIFRDSHGFVSKAKAQSLDDRRKEIWAEADKQAKILVEAIHESQAKILKLDPKFKRINPDNCTLDEFTAALERSSQTYEREDVKGVKGSLRKVLRKLGENAEVFKQFLEVIPSESVYTAPISAAFQIFLSMAGRIHTVREGIFEMMSAVPEDFDNLKEELGVYRDIPDERLSERAADVCTNIFCTLQHAMRFMGEHPLKKVIKSFKLDNYESVIESSLSNLRKSKKDFQNEVKRCVRSRIESIYWKVDSSNKTQWHMLCEAAKNKDEIINTVRDYSDDIKKEMRQELSNVALNALHTTLISEHNVKHIVEMAVRKGLELKEHEARQRNSLDTSELLKLLNLEDLAPEHDILTALSEVSSMSPVDISRLSWFKHNSSLRKWIVNSKSAPLFIEGNTDESQSFYLSPLSFLCAEMANLFEPLRNTISLTYFCGLHAEPSSGRRADANGMMMNLIGQLLQQKDHGEDRDHYIFEEALVKKTLRHGIKRADLQALCATFEELILQLPSSWTVVCFIDMIDFYETQQRVDETLEAVLWLLKLLKRMKKSKSIVFKLLITASRISHVVGREFSDKHRIWAPEVPNDSSELQIDLLEVVQP